MNKIELFFNILNLMKPYLTSNKTPRNIRKILEEIKQKGDEHSFYKQLVEYKKEIEENLEHTIKAYQRSIINKITIVQTLVTNTEMDQTDQIKQIGDQLIVLLVSIDNIHKNYQKVQSKTASGSDSKDPGTSSTTASTKAPTPPPASPPASITASPPASITASPTASTKAPASKTTSTTASTTASKPASTSTTKYPVFTDSSFDTNIPETIKNLNLEELKEKITDINILDLIVNKKDDGIIEKIDIQLNTIKQQIIANSKFINSDTELDPIKKDKIKINNTLLFHYQILTKKKKIIETQQSIIENFKKTIVHDKFYKNSYDIPHFEAEDKNTQPRVLEFLRVHTAIDSNKLTISGEPTLTNHLAFNKLDFENLIDSNYVKLNITYISQLISIMLNPYEFCNMFYSHTSLSDPFKFINTIIDTFFIPIHIPIYKSDQTHLEKMHDVNDNIKRDTRIYKALCIQNLTFCYNKFINDSGDNNENNNEILSSILLEHINKIKHNNEKYIFNYKLVREINKFYITNTFNIKKQLNSKNMPLDVNAYKYIEIYYYHDVLTQSIKKLDDLIKQIADDNVHYYNLIDTTYNDIIMNDAQILTYVKERDDGYMYGYSDNNPRYDIKLTKDSYDSSGNSTEINIVKQQSVSNIDNNIQLSYYNLRINYFNYPHVLGLIDKNGLYNRDNFNIDNAIKIVNAPNNNKLIESYTLGKINRYYGHNINASDISQDSEFGKNVIKKLKNFENIIIIGNGQSGSGKTSALICLDIPGKYEPGILPNIANQLLPKTPLIDVNFNRVRVKLINLYVKLSDSLKEQTDITDDKYFLYNIQLKNGNNPIVATEFIFEPIKNPANSNNIEWLCTSPSQKANISLDKIIAESFEIREEEPTKNNPNSSRSHIIACITFMSDKHIKNGQEITISRESNIVICDLAGVEDKFPCTINDLYILDKNYTTKSKKYRIIDESTGNSIVPKKKISYDNYMCENNLYKDLNIPTDILNDRNSIIDNIISYINALGDIGQNDLYLTHFNAEKNYRNNNYDQSTNITNMISNFVSTNAIDDFTKNEMLIKNINFKNIIDQTYPNNNNNNLITSTQRSTGKSNVNSKCVKYTDKIEKIDDFMENYALPNEFLTEYIGNDNTTIKKTLLEKIDNIINPRESKYTNFHLNEEKNILEEIFKNKLEFQLDNIRINKDTYNRLTSRNIELQSEINILTREKNIKLQPLIAQELSEMVDEDNTLANELSRLIYSYKSSIDSVNQLYSDRVFDWRVYDSSGTTWNYVWQGVNFFRKNNSSGNLIYKQNTHYDDTIMHQIYSLAKTKYGSRTNIPRPTNENYIPFPGIKPYLNALKPFFKNVIIDTDASGNKIPKQVTPPTPIPNTTPTYYGYLITDEYMNDAIKYQHFYSTVDVQMQTFFTILKSDFQRYNQDSTDRKDQITSRYTNLKSRETLDEDNQIRNKQSEIQANNILLQTTKSDITTMINTIFDEIKNKFTIDRQTAIQTIENNFNDPTIPDTRSRPWQLSQIKDLIKQYIRFTQLEFNCTIRRQEGYMINTTLLEMQKFISSLLYKAGKNKFNKKLIDNKLLILDKKIYEYTDIKNNLEKFDCYLTSFFEKFTIFHKDITANPLIIRNIITSYENLQATLIPLKKNILKVFKFICLLTDKDKEKTIDNSKNYYNISIILTYICFVNFILKYIPYVDNNHTTINFKLIITIIKHLNNKIYYNKFDDLFKNRNNIADIDNKGDEKFYLNKIINSTNNTSKKKLSIIDNNNLIIKIYDYIEDNSDINIKLLFEELYNINSITTNGNTITPDTMNINPYPPIPTPNPPTLTSIDIKDEINNIKSQIANIKSLYDIIFKYYNNIKFYNKNIINSFNEEVKTYMSTQSDLEITPLLYTTPSLSNCLLNKNKYSSDYDVYYKKNTTTTNAKEYIFKIMETNGKIPGTNIFGFNIDIENNSTIIIFTVINITADPRLPVNNPPNPPFININILKLLYNLLTININIKINEMSIMYYIKDVNNSDKLSIIIELCRNFYNYIMRYPFYKLFESNFLFLINTTSFSTDFYTSFTQNLNSLIIFIESNNATTLLGTVNFDRFTKIRDPQNFYLICDEKYIENISTDIIIESNLRDIFTRFVTYNEEIVDVISQIDEINQTE
jgi:hypothetical protein